MKMSLKYSIGLDIGVTSVGWACMTDEFRIPKFNGRYAMGVREFEAAETAEARRIQRGTRRRYNRRIKRIQLLQQAMNPLFQNDPGFFMESEEKHFWRNSNRFENNSLSKTLSLLGKNSRTFPTIYHLRYALLNEDKPFHPRLIYLALHHLVKFRGHFLNENMNWNHGDKTESIDMLLREYFEELKNHSFEITIDDEKVQKLVQIMENKDLTNSDKRTAILRVIGREFRHPVTLILGLRADIAQLFPESDNHELYKEEKLKLSFADEDITEVYEKLLEDEKSLIDKANVIYQNILLKDLLGQASCVAEAKVLSYDQFKEDLQLLKQIYNDHFGEKEYRAMFITSRKNQTKFNKTRNSKLLCEFDKFLRIKKEEDKFYRTLLQKLKELQKDTSLTDKQLETVLNIIERLERNQFLQKQKSQINAAIPHQNNVYEAERILKNQQKYYPEITEEIIEKVKQIISFRIPYYIGPLVKNAQQSEFGWAKRQSDSPVTPWTIEDVIDRSQSAEEFINRMTSFCAYLLNEKVLPKHSLLYEKFEVLNELNGIQIRSSYETPNRKYRLGKEEKAWIIENVFSKYKNVTHAILIRELKKSPYKDIILDENIGGTKEIFGTQKEDRFSTSLSTYIDMKNIFKEVQQQDYKMLEEIIYWITVFEEKEIIEMKINEKYGHISKEKINRLINLSYSGWGRLSKKLLDELPASPKNHETIIEVMERNPMVFMEVLSNDSFNLNERIAKMNQIDNEKYTKIRYRDIKELQGSPALKKGIWQATLIVEELTEIFGEPEHIMIEFARHDDKKERTKARKKQIEDLHKAVGQDEKELKNFLKEHSQYEEADYRDNRLFLYITQQGKCLYSGESLNISRLQDYEVDHILPRSFVKDDSLDNLALVKTEMNQKKGNEKMPLEVIEPKIKWRQKKYWQRLFDNNLISQRKYQRLIKETFSDQDKESFFARQLVETRQITKHVKDLLNERFEKTEVHPVNATIINRLRAHTNTFKIRDLNNKHHAVDAAITVLIIQFIINKYGSNFLNFNFKFQEARRKWREMLTTHGKNFFLFADIDQYDRFTHYKTGELLSGRQFLHMLNNEMPWQTTKKLGSNEGAFYDQTIYSPKVRKPQYSSGKIAKGVHSDVKVDSSYLISYAYLNKRGQEKLESDIVNFTVIEKYQTKSLSEEQLAFILAEKVAKGPIVKAKIHKRILKHQLVIVDDHPLYFVSNRELNNAKQFYLQPDTLEKLYTTFDKEKETDVSFLKSVFQDIAEAAIKQFENYLPESRIENIKSYRETIIDKETYLKGIEELFKMANAGPARSNVFGGRYVRRLDPTQAKFVYQSITGLRHRKPKSYKQELWSV